MASIRKDIHVGVSAEEARSALADHGAPLIEQMMDLAAPAMVGALRGARQG